MWIFFVFTYETKHAFLKPQVAMFDSFSVATWLRHVADDGACKQYMFFFK